MRKLLVVLSLALYSLAACSNEVVPTLAIWDDAVVGSDTDLTRAQTFQLVFSNRPLKKGDRLTALVPLEPGFRVLCCIDVVEAEPMSLESLAKKYAEDSNFVQRMKSMKGVAYAYRAAFAPDSVLNQAMRRLAQGSGSSYYSAPALLGTTSLKRLDADVFDWDGIGLLKLTFSKGAASHVTYRLKADDQAVSLTVEDVPR